MKAAFITLLLLSLPACGQSAPSDDPSNKLVPRIARTYLGQSLDSWLQDAQHADPAVRTHAAWALGRLYGDTHARRAAITRLLADPDASVRFAAVIAAGRIPVADPESARLVVSQLVSDRPGMATHAALAASAIGAPAIDEVLVLLRLGSTDARVLAAHVLQRMSGLALDAVPALRTALTTDDAIDVRRRAAAALANIGARGPEVLAALLRGEHATVAEYGLRHAGPGAVGVLTQLLTGTNEEDADFAAAIFSVRRSLARRAVPALIQVLGREGPVAVDAADALVRVGARVLPALDAAHAQAVPETRVILREIQTRILARGRRPQSKGAKR